jgi:hypothetical protein
MSGSGNLNEKKEYTGFHLKSMRIGVFLIVSLLSVMAIVPMVSAVGKNITINITSPEEEDVIFYDVVPAYIEVQGTIDAPLGIRNVSIMNGLTDTYGEVVCGSNWGTHYDISCKILITDHITIKVTDNSGFVVSETRNFTSYAGPPPPGTIWLIGWVVDSKGQPIPNASIIFETLGENNPVTAMTKSGLDGMYKTKKAFGFYQRVTVQKEGYQTFVREVRFKEYSNEFNITLTPQGKSVPGFNSEVAVSAIIIGFFIVDVWRRR